MQTWTVGDNNDVVYETGLYNLTEDETQMLIHFGTERTQQWMLVRLDSPDEVAGRSRRTKNRASVVSINRIVLV